ncbi:hypothetical protein RYH73_18460 [Olivibacter sp. CPCC 100613]|uniref:hypothetical protein n=1 Tax=Olivibacter sp. CPCC 100613 TaxID=3079931 RepID=UPI002FFA1451
MKLNLSSKLFAFFTLVIFGCKKEGISNNAPLFNENLIGTWSVESIKNVTLNEGEPIDSVIVGKTNISIKFDESKLCIISNNQTSSDIEYTLSHIEDNEFIVTINKEKFFYSKQGKDRMLVRNTSKNGENQEIIQMVYKKIK